MKRILLFCMFIMATASLANDKEILLKGVVLEKINHFISYQDKHQKFKICVYKNDKIADSFTNLFKTKTYKKLPIEISHTESIQQAQDCDILYVDKPSSSVIDTLSTHRETDRLLVTNDLESLADGFMIALYFKNNKIRFAINQKALLDAGLKVNYRLLKVASKIINPLKVH